MSDDLRARLIAVLDQSDSQWFGIRRRDPADDAIPVALPHLTEARGIAEELARRHPSTRVRVHALQLWSRLCIFDPVAGQGTARPGLGEDRLATFRGPALELARDPDGAVRAAAAIQLLSLSELDMLPALRAQLTDAERDIRAHRDQPGADDAMRRLAGPAGATAVIRIATATDVVAIDDEVGAAVRALIDTPDRAAAGPLAALWPHLLATGTSAAPAAQTLLAWVMCSAPDPVEPVVAMLAQTTPAQQPVLVHALREHGARGAQALAAIARATTLPAETRGQALASLAHDAHLNADVAKQAAVLARELDGDPAVGVGARRLAVELGML